MAVMVAAAVIIVVPGPGSSQPASFPFPASYGTPVVPAGIGAQGHQGINVPLASLGASGYGTSGHVGPVNLSSPVTFGKTATTVTVTVYNGTISSHSAAVGQPVTLRNLTDTWFADADVAAVTSGAGVVTLSAYEGTWVLSVQSTSATYDPFWATVMINASSASYSVYLIPSSSGTKVVHNGPTASDTGNVWVTAANTSAGLMPQVMVELENSSSGNAVIAYANTTANGSVHFTQLDTAFTYQALWDDFGQPASGWRWGMLNVTWSIGTPGTNTVLNQYALPLGRIVGHSWTTGTVTGTALPPFGTWTLSANSVITGGYTVIGASVGGTGLVLSFVNALVFLNYSYGGFTQSLNGIHCVNSTLIATYGFYMNVVRYFATGDHCAVFFDYPSYLSILSWQKVGTDDFTYFNSSYVQGLPGHNSGIHGKYRNSVLNAMTIFRAGFQMQAVGTYAGSEIVNSFMSLAASTNLSSDLITNSTVGLQGGNEAWINLYNSYFVNASSAGQALQALAPKYGALQLGNAISGNVSHDTILFTPPTGVLFNALQNNSYCNGYSLGAGQNISLDVFNITYPMCEVTITAGAVSVLYDDWFQANATVAQYKFWNSQTRFLAGLPGGIQYLANFPVLGENGTLRNSMLDGQGMEFKWGARIDHNVFGGTNNFPNGGYSSATLQSPSNVQNAVESNDTFLEGNVNRSDFNGVGNYANGDLGITGIDTTLAIFGTQVVAAFYDTFRGQPAAQGADAQGRFSTVEDCLFLNYGDTGPDAQYVNPLSWDLQLSSGLAGAQIVNNYFIALNNGTMPLEFDRASGSTSALAMSNNHFYWSPNGSAPLPVGSTSNVHGAQWTYAVLSEYKTTGQTGAGLVFNTTKTYSAAKYVWTVAPDVNASGTTPVLSYLNGLVAGPQPNFFWYGFNYSEEVEPGYVSIGVNSTSAPPITVHLIDASPFGGPAFLSVYNATTGAPISQTSVTVPTSGVYDGAFTPANESAGVIIALISEAGFGSAGHVNLAPIVMLAFITAVAAGIIYLGTRRRRTLAWKG